MFRRDERSNPRWPVSPTAVIWTALWVVGGCGDDGPAPAQPDPVTAPAAPAPAPPPTLPAKLSIDLTDAELTAADAMRRTLSAGKAPVPTDKDVRVWLAVIDGHADPGAVARSLVTIGHRRHGNAGAFTEVFSPHRADLALVATRLTERGDDHLARLAIRQLLAPLLAGDAPAPLATAVDVRLGRLAGDTARDPSVRGLAAGTIGDVERMRTACSALLADADPYVAWHAMASCNRPPLANRLIGLTRHALAPVRARAVQALARATREAGDSGDTEGDKRAAKFAERYILPMLDAPEPHVRGGAIEALGHIASVAAVASLAADAVAKHVTDGAATAHAHVWKKADGSVWRQGNVPLLLDQGSVSAQAAMAFNRMSGGAITTGLHPRDRPGDAEREAAAEQARQWLAARP